jgi:hypothetical protein
VRADDTRVLTQVVPIGTANARVGTDALLRACPARTRLSECDTSLGFRTTRGTFLSCMASYDTSTWSFICAYLQLQPQRQLHNSSTRTISSDHDTLANRKPYNCAYACQTGVEVRGPSGGSIDYELMSISGDRHM